MSRVRGGDEVRRSMFESVSAVDVRVRPARTSDVLGIQRLVDPLVQKKILLGKDLVVLYESIQEFIVAEIDGELVGCGALHVIWDDLGEVRTLAVAEEHLHRGVGRALLERLETRASDLGVTRLFCLTFETEFFGRHGYLAIGEEGVVPPEVYYELVRSPDEGVAEFLDLARVKPNTLGNTRMLKDLVSA